MAQQNEAEDQPKTPQRGLGADIVSYLALVTATFSLAGLLVESWHITNAVRQVRDILEQTVVVGQKRVAYGRLSSLTNPYQDSLPWQASRYDLIDSLVSAMDYYWDRRVRDAAYHVSQMAKAGKENSHNTAAMSQGDFWTAHQYLYNLMMADYEHPERRDKQAAMDTVVSSFWRAALRGRHADASAISHLRLSPANKSRDRVLVVGSTGDADFLDSLGLILHSANLLPDSATLDSFSSVVIDVASGTSPTS